MLRYIRAFVIALKMTLTGEKTPPVPYPNLQSWMREGQAKVGAVYQAAKQAGLDHTRLDGITLAIDKRPISLETVVGAVRFHLQDEYPALIRMNDEHTLTTIYALNLDDQHRMQQVIDHDMLPASPLLASLKALHEHLNNIPPSHQA